MFNTLGRIQELRTERGWSVYKLAKLSGIPQSTIATWYRKNLCPPIDKLEVLCDTFGVTLAEFFDREFPELSPDKALLLKRWGLLDKKRQDAIMNIIEAFLS